MMTDIMADTNLPFPLTLGKPETQTLGGLVIGSFALGRVLGSYSHFPNFSSWQAPIFHFH